MPDSKSMPPPNRTPRLIRIVYDSFLLACARSCSMICLLQLFEGKQRCRVSNILPQNILQCDMVMDSLSAGEESARLGHLVAMFPLSAETPSHSSNADKDGTHHCSVCSPVRRLRVPASGGRPDFLGVTAGAHGQCLARIEVAGGLSVRCDEGTY